MGKVLVHTIADLLERAIPEPNTGCFLWLGRISASGYAVSRINAKEILSHRAAYQLAHHVRLTPEQRVCHSCDQPTCINPEHLFIGTPLINSSDMVLKGRSNRRKSGLPYGVRSDRYGHFDVQVKFAGELHYLGRYDDPEEAGGVAVRFARSMRQELVREAKRKALESLRVQQFPEAA